MTDLDVLKEKWMEYDQKLDVNIRLTRQLLDAAGMNRARSAMRRLMAFVALDAAATLMVIMALGSFIGDNIAAARFVVPAIMLDAAAILTFGVLIRQLMLARLIDYSAPVTLIQKRLETLRILRIRRTLWTLFASPLLWPPLLIVSLKAFLGVDAYAALGMSYLLANLLLGVGVLGLAVWVSRKFGERMGRSPAIQRMMRELAGYNLNAASRFLAEIGEFAG